MSDLDFVRQYVGDAPPDDLITAAITAQGSPAAAALWMVRKTLANMVNKPLSAAVEGYSYTSIANVNVLQGYVAELTAMVDDENGFDGGSIDLVRADDYRGGGFAPLGEFPNGVF